MTSTTKNIALIVVALVASILFAKIELPTITTFILLAGGSCYVWKSLSTNITKWRKKGLLGVTFFVALVGLQRAGSKIYHNVFNDAGFEQKVVLITGTASGIGKATAEHLIEQGHIVYGGDIQFEKNKFLDDIGGNSLDMDVTKVDMVQAGVDKVIEEQGRIDVLFNNAGFGLYGPIEEITMDDAKWQFEVNVFGYANLVKAVLPHMRTQGDGLIINNTSMGGKIYLGGLGGRYHASKHALEGWSDVLRFEVKKFGIDVVVVEPGAINTNFFTPVMEYMEKYRKDTAYEHAFIPFDGVEDDVDNAMGSDPIVIAKVVNQAINAKHPKTRYTKGQMGNELIFMRELLGDAVFEWIMEQMFG